MNTKTLVAGLAVGSLLVVGVQATQSVRAESGPSPMSQARQMSGWHEDCQGSMASMMWMMHQHHAMMGGHMMGEGMMGAGPEGMMDGGMMGVSPTPEAMAAPPSAVPSPEALAPGATSGAGHELHHPSPSPVASASPS